MKKTLSKLSLYQNDCLKKPQMKWYRGGERGYLYCTMIIGNSTVSGYCGTASTEDECCDQLCDMWDWDDCSCV